MDILGPFTLRKGQVKVLLVSVHYFTKWILAYPLATITAQHVQNFAITIFSIALVVVFSSTSNI